MVLESKSVRWYHIIRNGVSEGPSYDITIASCFSQRIPRILPTNFHTKPRHHQRSTGWWRLNDVIQQDWTEQLLWYTVYTPSNKRNLVGGLPTPLKNMKVSWDDEIPNIWNNKKCSKPPTRHVPWQHVSMSEPAQLKNPHVFPHHQGYDYEIPGQLPWKTTKKWFENNVIDSNFPNNIERWTIVTQIKKRERISMWLTTILMPICFFYLLRGSVPPLFWATTHANVAPRLLDAVGSAMGHEGIAASERRDLDINQSVVGMFHQYP